MSADLTARSIKFSEAGGLVPDKQGDPGTTVARQNGVLVASVDGGAFGPLALVGAEGRLLARSSSFMSSDFASKFDEFMDVALTSLWGVAGTAAVVTTVGPGVASFVNTNATLITRTPAVVANASLTKWHVAGRFALVTAPAANEIKGMALDDGGGTVNSARVGLRQATSGSKFVFTVTKASTPVTALSTVNLDTGSFHVGEIWFDGVNVYGSVDNEAPVLVTSAANVPTAILIERHGVEVAAGGAIGFYLDYSYAAAGRTAS